MNCRRATLLRRLLAFSIALGTISACGARTSLELADDVGPDGGDQDHAPSCGGWGQPCCDHSVCDAGLMCSDGTCISVDAGSPPPSCAAGGAGLTNCGVTDGGSDGESCCTSLEVPAGTYFRTYTNTGIGPTGEADPATVSGFRLDKYDVTVGRFAQFASAWRGGWLPAPGSGKHTHLNGGHGLANSASPGAYEPGWIASDDQYIAPTDMNLACLGDVPSSSRVSNATWTTSAGDRENLPINCVAWYDAYAFCIWDGGFLPSEAEFEYAAAGGSQQREYPWGSAAPGTDNDYAIYGCHFPAGAKRCSATTELNITPVGAASSGVGLWGQLDLGGEVDSWNLDSWDDVYVDPCTDCTYLAISATNGVLRGGAFEESVVYTLPPTRNFNARGYRYPDVGFRCARIP